MLASAANQFNVQVVGDVVCEKVMVLKEGKVFGDISASSLTLGPDVSADAYHMLNSKSGDTF